MTEQEYRNLPNTEYFSASFLKMFDKEGPECLIKKIEYKGKELLKGSIIDDLAFNKEDFENIYYVSDSIKEPTRTEIDLINTLKTIITVKEIEEEIYTLKGLKVIKELKLWNNIKNEKILINKLKNKDFVKNLKAAINADNKIVISGNDYMNALDTVRNLKTNPFTKDYFLSKDIKVKQVLFQIPIIFNIKDDKFKSLLDIILIDHESKTIKAVDLKTGFDNNKAFLWSILKWRYDIQAALYTKALESYIVHNDLKDYSIENPVFIFTQVSKQDRPLPFEFEPHVLRAAFNGFTLENGFKYKGILELVEEIKWHRNNNIYNYYKTEFENKKIKVTKKALNISVINKNEYKVFNKYNINGNSLSFITDNSVLERYLRNQSDRAVTTLNYINSTPNSNNGIINESTNQDLDW